jgi:hypothetical protein
MSHIQVRRVVIFIIFFFNRTCFVWHSIIEKGVQTANFVDCSDALTKTIWCNFGSFIWCAFLYLLTADINVYVYFLLVCLVRNCYLFLFELCERLKIYCVYACFFFFLFFNLFIYFFVDDFRLHSVPVQSRSPNPPTQNIFFNF